MCSHKNLYMNDHSNIIYDNQDMEITQLSIKWPMEKQIWYIHAMGYYLCIKRNVVLIYAIPWMNFENIMLNLRSQTSKATYYMITSTWSVQMEKPIETESRLVISRGKEEKRNGEWLFNVYMVSFWSDGHILELVVMVAQYWKYSKITNFYTLKW